MAKTKILLFIMLVLSSVNSNVFGQTNSVLASGTWIKLSISQDNIYKITFDDLQSYGIDPASIDPATIRIFGNGSGMLPQANNEERTIDLDEIAIEVVGQNDGTFNPEDYIFFYGSGPNIIDYDSLNKAFYYQNHVYSSRNHYFLNFNQSTGKRISPQASPTGGVIHTSAYDVYVHENDQVNILHSGRQWFGELFDLVITQSFTTTITDIQSNTDIKLVSAVMSSSLQDASFRVDINGIQIGNQDINGNPAGTYSTKGTVAIDTFLVNKNIIDNNPLVVTYMFQKDLG